MMEKGRLLTPDFTTYHIPGAMDVPEINSQIVENWEPSGPYGMKGVGEVAFLVLRFPCGFRYCSFLSVHLVLSGYVYFH